jgi:hypothetical protein
MSKLLKLVDEAVLEAELMLVCDCACDGEQEPKFGEEF